MKENTMDYRFLTPEQRAQISRQKFLELEAEHARLALDLRLADATGVDNPNVDTAKGQLAILVAQIAALTTWMAETPIEGQLVAAGSNGVGG